MNTMTEISNTDDVIDSRQVIERIEELRDQLDDEAERPTHNLTDEEIAELEALDALAAEASGSPDWAYGETLIRDSYFEDYARELAEEIGAIPEGAGWPLYCIDWEHAARELRHDYMGVDFAGVTYWIRA